ncbi:tRNA pseudouridine(38-40) synthase TruA [Thiomicrorhabdus aquaedulcis]|uniref:tRNA pseudouridine(38-40) synthase TruA n=1 Tax=Thiomicrorhabdus aquaedulcis TaxID=2211106 RepID=UPI000FD84B7C|nr:tRNA pseudouridine(38-40) synthase TruA [Thiomicrorhabdus aquaedulcis]
MNKRIALGVEYMGTQYCGWQRQQHCASVQSHLEQALSAIAATPISVHCAGRTDTGVHALGQVAHFETTVIRPNRAWLQGVNTHLPGDIRVGWVNTNLADDFHARFSAVARQYRYVIYNRPVHSAVLFNRVTWEKTPLDANAMHQAAQALIGEQDFSSFRASTCQSTHARREVQWVTVSRKGDFVFIDVQANAFLHHMVRNIAGSLLQVGKGAVGIEWLAEVLAKLDRTQAAPTAPACGLYFVNALYPDACGIERVSLNEVLWQ